MQHPDENAFLDHLYATAVQPEMWEGAIELLADLVGGSSAWLSRLNIIDGSGSAFTSRIDPVMPALYLEHFAAINPLNNVANPEIYVANWRPLVLTDEDWMPKHDLLRTEFYSDFMRPQDVHSTMMIRLALHGSEVSVLNINRSKRAGRFSSNDLERAKRLQPHLIRAYALGQRMVSHAPQTHGLRAVFDNLAAGLFLADRHARIIRLNAAGEALAAAAKGLRVQRGMLLADNAVATSHLHALIRQAASEDPGCRTGGFMSLLRIGTGRPLSVSVTPVRSPVLPVFDQEPCVLICASDLEITPALSERKLRELFALSAAEARVARAVLRGESLREAAAGLGVSVHTVNNQLASIFHKTGVNRQSALVRLMTRLSDLHLH